MPERASVAACASLGAADPLPTLPRKRRRDHAYASSWPDLFRPSTSLVDEHSKDVDARDEREHDENRSPLRGIR
jgi:hypothetical protein